MSLGLVAVTVNGEVQRLDPNTTIAAHVVGPLARAGLGVVVFLTLQSKRPKTSPREWHSHRFVNMPIYTDNQERDMLERLANRFLSTGAAGVRVSVYSLIRRPPHMPSRYSGARPGNAKQVARFQLVWPSYALHLLVHSMVWRDVREYEEERTLKFDFVYKMRADAGWLADAPLPKVHLDANVVHVKKCLAWRGINDKLALIPRAYADNWMRLLELYYDDTFHGYKNSEQYQLLLSRRYHIPVKSVPHALASLDFYWWLPDRQGQLGCFPWNYAGIVDSQVSQKCDCVDADLCRLVHSRLCAGERPLGPGSRRC